MEAHHRFGEEPSSALTRGTVYLPTAMGPTAAGSGLAAWCPANDMLEGSLPEIRSHVRAVSSRSGLPLKNVHPPPTATERQEDETAAARIDYRLLVALELVDDAGRSDP